MDLSDSTVHSYMSKELNFNKINNLTSLVSGHFPMKDFF